MTEGTDKPRLWAPQGLGRRDPSGLSYVVVDEIEGGMVGLAVSEWPRVDAHGRLRFESPPVLLGADRGALERFLFKRKPRALAKRPLRIGDTFAVRARPERLREAEEAEARLEPVLAPEDWIEPPVFDVTPDARDAAKASFYAAVTPSLAPAQVAGMEEIIEPPRPQPRPLWQTRLLQVSAGAALFAAGIGAGVGAGGVAGAGAEHTVTKKQAGSTKTEHRTTTVHRVTTVIRVKVVNHTVKVTVHEVVVSGQVSTSTETGTTETGSTSTSASTETTSSTESTPSESTPVESGFNQSTPR